MERRPKTSLYYLSKLFKAIFPLFLASFQVPALGFSHQSYKIMRSFYAPAANPPVLKLDEAIKAAEANNRDIRVADLEREKALNQASVARTYRWPVFSLTAIGSEPLSTLGLKFQKGAFGNVNAEPFPTTDITLRSPKQLAGLGYANVAQPLSEQYKIRLGVQAAQVGIEAANETIRLKRQTTINEVRRLYYGIVQTESGKESLQETVEFLKELDRNTSHDVVQRVALQADSLNVKAQLAKAEFELMKLDDPLQTQKQQLNRLLGRDVDTPFEVDASSATDFELPQLEDAYAKATQSRPEIRLAKLQLRKAELDRKIKNAERIPDIDLSFTGLATQNLTNAFPTRVAGVGLQLTWDVFDWGRKRKEVAERRETAEQAGLQLKEAEAMVRIDVSHQYRRLLEARKEVEVAKLSQSAASEFLRVTKNRYAQHEALLSDALKAQSTLGDTNYHYTQALANLATIQADFQKAIGEDQ